MGYTTDFTGKFTLNKQLTLDDYQWLKDFNEERHEGVMEYSYYCQWIPSKDGWSIEWDGGEKFYLYTEWIEYLINHFFEPRGYVLNGEVEWSGEEQGDIGKIIVTDNVVSEKRGRVTFD